MKPGRGGANLSKYNCDNGICFCDFEVRDCQDVVWMLENGVRVCQDVV